MKPLLVMLTHNRIGSSKRALTSLRETADLNRLDVHLVDNGSTDGTAEWLSEQEDMNWQLWYENIGVAQAINLILECHRKPRQHFIKMDDDVEIQSKGWLDIWLEYLAENPDTAMIGARQYWSEVFVPLQAGPIKGHDGYFMTYVPNTFCIYSGLFMDKVGYLDVLGEGHKFGYIDHLLVAKARFLKMPIVCLETVGYKPCATRTACVESITRWQQPFKERLRRIRKGHFIYTDWSGQPCES